MENLIGGVPEVGGRETIITGQYDNRAVVAATDKICSKRW